jgi:nitrate reductase alpha subunit
LKLRRFAEIFPQIALVPLRNITMRPETETFRRKERQAMDMKMQAFLDKVKDMADKTGKVSRHAAGVAGKKANDLALATRINLQIFDLNTECEALYKEIGKLVYDLHRGAEVTNEEMDEKMAQVDAKQEKLAALRDKLAEMRSVTACPHCGKPCGRDDAYCSSCGAEL